MWVKITKKKTKGRRRRKASLQTIHVLITGEEIWDLKSGTYNRTTTNKVYTLIASTREFLQAIFQV